MADHGLANDLEMTMTYSKQQIQHLTTGGRSPFLRLSRPRFNTKYSCRLW